MIKLGTVFTAVTALKRNIMRALLTTLGIMIGIAAVIAMVEIGQGSQKAIQQTISSMGANNLMVLPGAAASGGVSFGSGSVLTLTPQDAEAISELPSLLAVAPVVRTRGQAVYQNKNWVPSAVTGTTPQYLEVQNWKGLLQGTMFTDQDVRNASAVCVVGTTIVREIFEGVSPIGKELRIQNVSLKVIGVLRRKGANMMGMDQDDVIMAPWTTIKMKLTPQSANTAAATENASATEATSNSLYPGRSSSLYPGTAASQQKNHPISTKFPNIDQIVVAAKSQAQTTQAIIEIEQLLRQRHRLAQHELNDFNIRDMTEMIKTMSSTSDLMTRLLLCVAMISLVVGGVGIMNIMLVSVTERTREIGLRMAVGATARDILEQFLMEAVVLCVIGGAVGIVGGRMASYAITSFLKWPTEQSLTAIIGAVVVSTIVGVVFGFYPALRASKLDPIEALRYE